jgi:hypothetical protein
MRFFSRSSLVATACALAKLIVAAFVHAAPLNVSLPDHVLASVVIENPGPCCSGTIVSCGEKWASGISASHCFRGIVGGKFSIRFANGTHAQATLLTYDRERDLVRFAVPASAILAAAPVPETFRHTVRYEACGYPRGRESATHYLRVPGRREMA